MKAERKSADVIVLTVSQAELDGLRAASGWAYTLEDEVSAANARSCVKMTACDGKIGQVGQALSNLFDATIDLY